MFSFVLPKYPLPNHASFESGEFLAGMHSHSDNSLVKEQALIAKEFFQPDNIPTTDLYQEALTHILGHDPGPDPSGDGWSAAEIRAEFGNGDQIVQQCKIYLWENHPEAFPNQVVQPGGWTQPAVPNPLGL